MFSSFWNCSFLDYIIANKCSDCNTKCVSFGWIIQGNLLKSELMFENGQNMIKYKKGAARMVGDITRGGRNQVPNAKRERTVLLPSSLENYNTKNPPGICREDTFLKQ